MFVSSWTTWKLQIGKDCAQVTLSFQFLVLHDESIMTKVWRTIVIAPASLSSALLSSTVDKNFNLGQILWTTANRTFIFHMSIPCDKGFHIIP